MHSIGQISINLHPVIYMAANDWLKGGQGGTTPWYNLCSRAAMGSSWNKCLLSSFHVCPVLLLPVPFSWKHLLYKSCALKSLTWALLFNLRQRIIAAPVCQDEHNWVKFRGNRAVVVFLPFLTPAPGIILYPVLVYVVDLPIWADLSLSTRLQKCSRPLPLFRWSWSILRQATSCTVVTYTSKILCHPEELIAAKAMWPAGVCMIKVEVEVRWWWREGGREEGGRRREGGER